MNGRYTLGDNINHMIRNFVYDELDLYDIVYVKTNSPETRLASRVCFDHRIDFTISTSFSTHNIETCVRSAVLRYVRELKHELDKCRDKKHKYTTGLLFSDFCPEIHTFNEHHVELQKIQYQNNMSVRCIVKPDVAIVPIDHHAITSPRIIFRNENNAYFS